MPDPRTDVIICIIMDIHHTSTWQFCHTLLLPLLQIFLCHSMRPAQGWTNGWLRTAITVLIVEICGFAYRPHILAHEEVIRLRIQSQGQEHQSLFIMDDDMTWFDNCCNVILAYNIYIYRHEDFGTPFI